MSFAVLYSKLNDMTMNKKLTYRCDDKRETGRFCYTDGIERDTYLLSKNNSFRQSGLHRRNYLNSICLALFAIYMVLPKRLYRTIDRQFPLFWKALAIFSFLSPTRLSCLIVPVLVFLSIPGFWVHGCGSVLPFLKSVYRNLDKRTCVWVLASFVSLFLCFPNTHSILYHRQKSSGMSLDCRKVAGV